MATKKTADAAAAKARKQKIILAAGGLVLVAMAAIQVPKLMQHGGNAAPAPVSTTASAGVGAAVSETPPAASAAPATPTPTAVVVRKTGAVVAGVSLPLGGATVKASQGQLASFTLFEAKDPFVQKVGGDGLTAAEKAFGANNENGTAPPAGAAAAGGGSADKPAASGGSAGPGDGSATGSGEKQQPVPVKYATIDLDGKPQQVTLKQEFPSDAPLFVLKALKKKQATIAVAGGTFDDGATITLVLGKKVTLVNTATGVRYVLKLVYTGTQPEVIEGFTTGAAGSTTTTTQTTTTTAN